MDAPARGRAARLFLHRRTAEAPCVLPLTSPPRTRACVHAGGPRRALSLCPGNVSWRSWAREKEGSEDEGGGQRGRGKTGAGLGHWSHLDWSVPLTGPFPRTDARKPRPGTSCARRSEVLRTRGQRLGPAGTDLRLDVLKPWHGVSHWPGFRLGAGGMGGSLLVYLVGQGKKKKQLQVSKYLQIKYGRFKVGAKTYAPLLLLFLLQGQEFLVTPSPLFIFVVRQFTLFAVCVINKCRTRWYFHYTTHVIAIKRKFSFWHREDLQFYTRDLHGDTTLYYRSPACHTKPTTMFRTEIVIFDIQNTLILLPSIIGRATSGWWVEKSYLLWKIHRESK